MGLTIDMCHDIEQYKEDVVLGFDAKKSIFIIAAALVGAGTVALFHKVFGWSLFVSVYAMMPFCGTVILAGFYTRNGLTLGQIIRRKLKKVNGKPLVYKSTECRSVYEAAVISEVLDVPVSEEEKKAEINRMLRKLKIGLAIGGFVFVLLIVLSVVLSR